MARRQWDVRELVVAGLAWLSGLALLHRCERMPSGIEYIVLAGAFVRFWGLGAVGLHGDEKTMALPVMNLVEHGSPLMPSGMF